MSALPSAAMGCYYFHQKANICILTRAIYLNDDAGALQTLAPLGACTVNCLHQYWRFLQMQGRHSSDSGQTLRHCVHVGNPHPPCTTPTSHPWNETGGRDPTPTVWVSCIQQTKPHDQRGLHPQHRRANGNHHSCPPKHLCHISV